VFLALAMYKGYKNGFIKEIIGTIAVIAGLIGSFALAYKLTTYLNENTDWQSNFIPIISYFLVFIGIVLAVVIIGKLLNYLINITLLGIFNRVAGIAVSVLKFAFLLSVLVWLVKATSFVNVENLTNSNTFKYVSPVAPWVFDFFGRHFDNLNGLWESIKSQLGEPDLEPPDIII
jgi:membrane protein required for colicin V production